MLFFRRIICRIQILNLNCSTNASVYYVPRSFLDFKRLNALTLIIIVYVGMQDSPSYGWHVIFVTPVGFNVFVHGLLIHGQMFFNARANCPTSFTNINFITMQAFDFVYNVLIVATIWVFSRFASLAIIRATHCFFPWGKPL